MESADSPASSSPPAEAAAVSPAIQPGSISHQHNRRTKFSVPDDEG